MEADRSGYERLSSSEDISLQDVSIVLTDEAECPDSHLRKSLLAFLCCFPCGTVAVYNSIQVNRLFSRGKLEEALQSSERAELCSTRAFACMLMLCLFLLVLFVAGLVLLICFAFDCVKTSCDW